MGAKCCKSELDAKINEEAEGLIAASSIVNDDSMPDVSNKAKATGKAKAKGKAKGKAKAKKKDNGATLDSPPTGATKPDGSTASKTPEPLPMGEVEKDSKQESLNEAPTESTAANTDDFTAGLEDVKQTEEVEQTGGGENNVAMTDDAIVEKAEAEDQWKPVGGEDGDIKPDQAKIEEEPKEGQAVHFAADENAPEEKKSKKKGKGCCLCGSKGKVSE